MKRKLIPAMLVFSALYVAGCVPQKPAVTLCRSAGWNDYPVIERTWSGVGMLDSSSEEPLPPSVAQEAMELVELVSRPEYAESLKKGFYHDTLWRLFYRLWAEEWLSVPVRLRMARVALGHSEPWIRLGALQYTAIDEDPLLCRKLESEIEANLKDKDPLIRHWAKSNMEQIRREREEEEQQNGGDVQ
jgi:hypothetical protein